MARPNWYLYVLSVVVSIVVLVLLIGNSLSPPYSISTFVWIGVFSLLVGSFSGFVLDMFSYSSGSFLVGTCFSSFLPALFVAVNLRIEHLELLRRVASMEGAGIANSAHLHPFIFAFVMVFFFNLYPVYLFVMRKDFDRKYFVAYLYSVVLFLIVYYGISYLLSGMVVF